MLKASFPQIYLFILILLYITKFQACATPSVNEDGGETEFDPTVSSSNVLEYEKAPAGMYYDIDGKPGSFYENINTVQGGASDEDDFTALEKKMAKTKNAPPVQSEDEYVEQELKKLRDAEANASQGKTATKMPIQQNNSLKDNYRQKIQDEIEEAPVITNDDVNWKGLD